MYFTGNVRWVPPVQRFIEISSWLSLNSSSKSRMGENKTGANARLIVLLLFKYKKIPVEPISSMPRRSQVVSQYKKFEILGAQRKQMEARGKKTVFTLQ